MKWMMKTSKNLALAFVITLGLVFSMLNVASAVQESSKSASSKLVSIKSISVIGEDDSAELVIKLSSTATYTSYKTTAPLRLVLDISQTSQGAINAPLVFNKGNFKTVTATRFDTDAGVLTRVDIELNKDAEALISAVASKPGELRVSFPLDTTGTKNTALAKKTLEADVVPVTSGNLNSINTQEKPGNNNSVTARKTLSSISVSGNSVLLSIEGGFNNFKTFRLNKPERLVIDLIDARTTVPSRIVPLNSAGIASARVGSYPDKVRVVLDSIDGIFPEATVDKSDNGLLVSIKTNRIKNLTVQDQPVPENKVDIKKVAEISKPVLKPAAVSKPTTVTIPKQANTPKQDFQKVDHTSVPNVEMIDFQVVDGISRISVKVKGDVTVENPIKTPGFVTLTVKNATLSKSLQRSLETQSFISPVLRVTPLLIKTKKGNDTKIRIALKMSSPFEFRQEGDMLFVEFKNPEGLSADKVSLATQDVPARSLKNAKQPVQNMDADLSSELSPIENTSKSAVSSRSYKGRKVTLEFADAEVRKIFQLLSEVSNKNFVLGDDVAGTISIKLVNVPWDQALDIILDTKGLDKREDGNIIIIKGKGKFKSQADEELELKKALTKAIELKAEMFSINYSDVTSIVTQLNNLKTERGTIAQDARTNKIIVKDIPQVLDDMRKLIIQLDVPEKQVMIEARIVEATSTFTRSLGVNWGLHVKDKAGTVLGINQLDTSFGGQASNSAPTSGLTGNPGAAMGISFGTLASNVSLDLRLNAAATAGLIKIVSTPKVATLNNKTAKITQGQQVPYTSSTSDKVETKFVEAALSLEVTPHINANGTIGMKIDAKNDSVGQATGGSTAPAINKKQATTEMLLRDGETTVIGGIYVDSDNDTDDGVPYLMDIPFLGRLFKSNVKTKVKTELLIFITPRILNSI
jgi:type IV pilus assembly protein PilQ